jgi:hypothetical protein
MDVEGSGRGPVSGIVLLTCLEELGETISNQDSRSSGQDLNPGPPNTKQ